MIPDWQLPPGVDRGLWDYLHAGEMVAAYDEAMRASPLAAADIAFCDKHFTHPGRLVDLGCGTGRLCMHFAAKGYDCVGVDLSDEMLARAKDNLQSLDNSARYRVRFHTANIVDSTLLEGESFDYAACLFSTLGMVRGAGERGRVVKNAFRLLKPGGRIVLHAHNRYFRGLGWKRVLAQGLKTFLGRPDAGEITMPQAYAGAPLTLHHFTRGEVVRLLANAAFAVREIVPVGDAGEPADGSRVYGWLVMAGRR
jgi:SAM-dependent methyltransferase